MFRCGKTCGYFAWMLASAIVFVACAIREETPSVKHPGDVAAAQNETHEEEAAPEETVSLSDADALFKAHIAAAGGLTVKTEVIDVEGQPFSKALRVHTSEPPANWWDIQLLLSTTGWVREGDALLATFYLRGVETEDETGEAYVRAIFQSDWPPYTKSLVARWGAGRQWRQIRCPFESVDLCAPWEAVFGFAFGTGPQVIDIGGLSLVNYGKTVSADELPGTAVTYDGREADAPWRAAAQERIERIRKGDLRVSVRTGGGRPVANARVSVRMTRHAFPFGAAAVAWAADGRRFGYADGEVHWFTPEDERAYDYWLNRFFTKVTPEVALMPNAWTGHWPLLGREVAINTVERYRRMGFTVRGHMLVWPSWKYFWLPGIEDVRDDPGRLGPMVLEHIADEAGTLKDSVFEWTLLNEPLTHHDLMDILGREAMAAWFRAGREANPAARLYINDFSILSGAGVDLGHQQHYYDTIRFLLDHGAPLDGIGFQGHFGNDVTPPERIFEILERFAAFGRELQITEFDIDTRDLELQADYTRDFMTIVFSHPAICGLSLWGFWEKAHWRTDAALIDRDWKLKPNGEAYENLVRGEWWTEAESTTKQDGIVSIRGFLGDYSVIVQYAAEQREYSVKLPSEGTTLAIEW